MKKMEIDIKDTALGRHKALKKRECLAAVDDMDEDERAEFRRKLDMADSANNTTTTTTTTTTTADGTNTTTEV